MNRHLPNEHTRLSFILAKIFIHNFKAIDRLHSPPLTILERVSIRIKQGHIGKAYRSLELRDYF